MAGDKESQRLELDKRADLFRPLATLPKLSTGWIKAVRQSLQMTTTQLAKKRGVSQSSQTQIEAAEASGAITLNSLKKVAESLDCELVYALVPRYSLTDTLRAQARNHAAKVVLKERITKPKKLISSEDSDILKLTDKLIDERQSAIWDD